MFKTSDSQPGVHVPLGGMQAVSGGVRRILNFIKIKPQKVNKKGVLGYTKGVNFDLGVREGTQY